MKTVVALSGGIDSVVALYLAKARGDQTRCLFLDFGKPSSEGERASAKGISHELSVPLEIVDTKGLKEMQVGYASAQALLVDELDIAPWPWLTTDPHVSGFNVLLSIALFYAQLIRFDTVVVGLIKEQSRARPRLVEVGAKLSEAQQCLNPAFSAIQFDFPVSDADKPAVIKTGARLGVPFGKTWSCLRNNFVHCGECEQCRARKAAFVSADVVDPTSYL